MKMPKGVAHKILYYKMTGKKLNLKNPQDLNEKLQYLIVYKYRKKYGELADKYLVRNFVKKRGYEDILPKIYGVYNSIEEIDYDNLPNKFVIKPNNGSGGIFVCRDKKNLDFKNAKKSLKKSLKENFAEMYLEYHYSYIKPKIICEEFLEDKENDLPLDYKFYCFDGHVECLLLCSERSYKMRADYFDINWHPIDYSKKEYQSNKVHNKPKNFDKMLEIASALSKGFAFVRVDLYNIDGKIYFGEMTFTPSSGVLHRNTQKSLDYLGSLLDVAKVKKE